MLLVILIDIIVIGGMVYLATTKGFERTLSLFAFFVVLLPGESVIPIPGLFGLTTQRFAVVTLIGLFLIFGKRAGAEQKKKTALPLGIIILLHSAWCLVSVVNSIDPVMSLKAFSSAAIEYYLVYYIFYNSITTSETIERIVKSMVYAVGISTIFGAYEAYTGWEVISWFPQSTYRFGTGGIDIERGIRAQSTFVHPILYGGAIDMVIPLTLYLVGTERSKLRKVVLWIFLMLMFLCLYKTSSRGPWIGAIIGFTMTLFVTAKPVRKYMVVIVLLCVTVMVVRPGVYDTIKGFYDATFDPDSPMGSSYDYRYALKDVSQKALSRNTGRMLWGYGMESFYYLHLTGPFLGKDDHKFESCDSAWIQSMVETGYVGFYLFAFLLASATLLALRNVCKLRPPARYLEWIFAVNIIVYCFLMVSVAIYGWGQNGYMLWLTIAMALVYPQVQSEQAPAGKEALATPNPGKLEWASRPQGRDRGGKRAPALSHGL